MTLQTIAHNFDLMYVYLDNKKVEIETYNFLISLNWSKICMNAPFSELGVVAKCQ